MYIGTPYDDAFRILLTECSQLIIPVVNEMFGEHYAKAEEVVINNNEHFIVLKEGGRKIKVTDSSFTIGRESGKKRYHIECQSTKDKEMSVRMYEYDLQIAKEGHIYVEGTPYMKMPKSGVVFLRKDAVSSDSVIFDEFTYQVAAMKAFEYTLDDIFEKNLFFLVPFHFFVYEDRLKMYNEDKERLKELKEMYFGLWERLEAELEAEGYEDAFVLLYEQSVLVAEGLAHNYENILKEVVEPMFGVYHKSETRKAIEQGLEKGLEKGLEQGLEKSIRNLIANTGMDLEQAMDALGITDSKDRERFTKLIIG